MQKITLPPLSSRHVRLAALAVGVVVLASAGFAVYAYHLQNNKPATTASTPSSASPSSSTAATPTPTTAPVKVESHLNGILVDAGTENTHPLAVIIENHPDARPQYGLGRADLVYESVAEGGITRFMAVFGNANQVVRVGPIRSARTYTADMATELDAFYAHAGGSEPALAQVAASGFYNIDGLALGSPLFSRDYSRNVASEHTLYSSTDALWRYATETRKWPTTSNYGSWKFQDDIATASRPTAQKVSVSVSDPLYAVVWDYDPSTNSYLRTMAGVPHKDASTGLQLAAKNVILQSVDRQSLTESNGKQIYHYTVIGSGSATILQNGSAIKATWKKTSASDRTRYYDATTGAEISMVRGMTWTELTYSDTSIKFQ